MLVVFTQGFGLLLSSQIFINRIFAPMSAGDKSRSMWQVFWMTPVLYLIVVFVLFAILFREGPKKSAGGEERKA